MASIGNDSDNLAQYINQGNPLGPLDTDLIKHRDVEAKLFDPHYTAFDKLLSKEINVVIGRRGSGKTALLNCYKFRRLLNGNKLSREKIIGFDLEDYDIVFSTPVHTAFESLQLHVMGASGTIRSIESVVDDWDNLIVDLILFELIRHPELSGYFTTSNAAEFEIIKAYLNRLDTRQRLEASEMVQGHASVQRSALWPFQRKSRLFNEVTSRQDALTAAYSVLRSAKKKILFILDSMDEYQIGDTVADRTVGALLRFVKRFNLAHEKEITIKIGLPSEIFPEIQQACANPLKDMVKFDQITWTSMELARIAAHRYRIFLELYDPSGSETYRKFDFDRKSSVRQFWSNLFDSDIQNEYGASEDPITYILRHTQLLPRQLITVLEGVIKSSHERTGGYRELKSAVVNEMIGLNESKVADEIFSAYKHIYPTARKIGRSLFGNFPSVFSYDELEDRWRKAGKPFDYKNSNASGADFVDIMDMLLRIGIVGVVYKEPTEKYIQGMFSYNQLIPPNVGQGNGLCIHPIFGRHFRCALSQMKKAVLPYGVAFE